MRLDIRYRMHFRYPEEVREAHNEIRVRPADTSTQRLLAHRLTCNPAARVLSFTDYWGTTVDHVGHVSAHSELELIAEAAVETRPAEPVESAPLASVFEDDFVLDNVEYLASSPHVEQSPEVIAVGREIVAGSTDVGAAVQVVVDEVRNRLEYRSGSTRIGIPLGELVAGGAGVCQDFAHLTIGWLRGAGIPARYVSGYLFAVDETLGSGTESIVNVQTHAWVEAAIPGGSWLPVDPTNNQPVGERHVVIGHGRDYDDVAPVRGVYIGNVSPTVESSVEMRHMEPVDRSMTAHVRRRPQRLPTVPPLPDVLTASQQQQQQ